MASRKERYFARRPFDYGELTLDRLQIFELKGAVNDEKLVRLGYVTKLEERDPVDKCGVCGAEFRGGDGLNAHGNLRHARRFAKDSDEYADEIDRQHEIANQQAPLKLDQTKASRAA